LIISLSREPGGIMTVQRFTKSLKKAVGLAGVAGVSALLALPALAQQSNPTNMTPSVCLPRGGQVTPIESPTGGATMEQMQANNTQSMNQSNIGTSTYYGQSLPDGNRVSISSQVSAPPAGGNTAEYMQGSSNNRQINYLSRSDVGGTQSSQFRMNQAIPTNGPAGGYTMERFRAMTGDRSVMENSSASNYNNLNSNNRAYNYNSGYRTSQMPSLQGPAGGYSAGMVGDNNQSTYSSTFQSRSINRIGPSTDASGMNMNSMGMNTNQAMTTRPMPGSMSSDINRPAGEITPEASERMSEAIGGC
jgi:hypothetical protein